MPWLGGDVKAFGLIAGAAELNRLVAHVFKLGALVGAHIAAGKGRINFFDIVLALPGQGRG